jgi:hypothetical protein
MGDPISTAAIVSIASAGFSAGGSIMKGQGTNAADQYQSQRLQQQAEYGRLKATQTSAQMGEQLNNSIENTMVARAASGTDPSSPSNAAVIARGEEIGDRQKNISVDNIQRQANQDESDSAYMRWAGNQALNASYLSAGASVAGAFGKAGAGGSFGVKVPGYNPIAGASGS